MYTTFLLLFYHLLVAIIIILHLYLNKHSEFSVLVMYVSVYSMEHVIN